MIVKERPIPCIILLIEALLRWLPKDYHKRPLLEEELSIWRAGYRGEQSIDYHLNILPLDEYSIFHSLRLNHNGDYFQIDTLLISLKFLLIIEVKNYSGKIYFDKDHSQLIQIKDGQEKSYPDPIDQAKRHVLQLKEWLKTRGIPIPPMEYLVVISNSHTIIKSDRSYNEVRKYVCKPDHLFIKIQELEQKYKREFFDEKQIAELSDQLIKGHQPLINDVFKSYNINKAHPNIGVRCPNCREFQMIYERGIWECSLCQTKSKDAHIQPIMDHLLLYGPANNSTIRILLGLPSQRKTTYLLGKMNLPVSGTTKGYIYHGQPIL